MLKILAAVFMLILVPVYWKNYGIKNFLWLSDVGLFLTFFGLWLESPLLISMAAVAVLPLEILWIIDYFFQLITGNTIFNIANYMFEPTYSRFLRSLSFFHIAIPIILLWYLFKWGYDARALNYQIILVWITLILTYFFTQPTENINWVFLSTIKNWNWISSFNWLMLLLLIYPLFIFLPMHFLLKQIFPS